MAKTLKERWSDFAMGFGFGFLNFWNRKKVILPALMAAVLLSLVWYLVDPTTEKGNMTSLVAFLGLLIFVVLLVIVGAISMPLVRKDLTKTVKVVTASLGGVIPVILAIVIFTYWMSWPLISVAKEPDVDETEGFLMTIDESGMTDYTIEGPVTFKGVKATKITAKEVWLRNFTQYYDDRTIKGTYCEVKNLTMYVTYVKSTGEALGIKSETAWYGYESPPFVVGLIADPMTMSDVTMHVLYLEQEWTWFKSVDFIPVGYKQYPVVPALIAKGKIDLACAILSGNSNEVLSALLAGENEEPAGEGAKALSAHLAGANEEPAGEGAKAALDLLESDPISIPVLELSENRTKMHVDGTTMTNWSITGPEEYNGVNTTMITADNATLKNLIELIEGKNISIKAEEAELDNMVIYATYVCGTAEIFPGFTATLEWWGDTVPPFELELLGDPCEMTDVTMDILYQRVENLTLKGLKMYIQQDGQEGLTKLEMYGKGLQIDMENVTIDDQSIKKVGYSETFQKWYMVLDANGIRGDLKITIPGTNASIIIKAEQLLEKVEMQPFVVTAKSAFIGKQEITEDGEILMASTDGEPINLKGVTMIIPSLIAENVELSGLEMNPQWVVGNETKNNTINPEDYGKSIYILHMKNLTAKTQDITAPVSGSVFDGRYFMTLEGTEISSDLKITVPSTTSDYEMVISAGTQEIGKLRMDIFLVRADNASIPLQEIVDGTIYIRDLKMNNVVIVTTYIHAEDLTLTDFTQEIVINDIDGDGLSNIEELSRGMDPLSKNSDTDIFEDKWEVVNGLDPLVYDFQSADPDGDGLTNKEEFDLGTNPTKADTDGDGVSDGDEVTNGTDPLNHPPIADFTYSPDKPTTADTVEFNSISTDPDGSIVKYEWDFGDGTILYGEKVTHVFTSPGTYTVNLTVTDDKGETHSVTIEIEIGNQAPVAGFEYSPEEPTTADTVEFNSISTDPDGSIVKYEWDFGDGNTSTEEDPSHQYSTSGTYTVTLTVTDDKGETHSVTKDITVLEPSEPQEQ